MNNVRRDISYTLYTVYTGYSPLTAQTLSTWLSLIGCLEGLVVDSGGGQWWYDGNGGDGVGEG